MAASSSFKRFTQRTPLGMHDDGRSWSRYALDVRQANLPDEDDPAAQFVLDLVQIVDGHVSGVMLIEDRYIVDEDSRDMLRCYTPWHLSIGLPFQKSRTVHEFKLAAQEQFAILHAENPYDLVGAHSGPAGEFISRYVREGYEQIDEEWPWFWVKTLN